MNLVWLRYAGFALCLSLTACGGDDSPSPQPSSPPPLSVTSASTASVSENSTAIFYEASASGGSGNTTFSLGNTQDAARFSITSAGALSFSDPANFDLEYDADGNNVFELQIVARSGSQSASRNLSVTLQNLREGIRVTRIATGFVDPVGLARTDNVNELIVAEKGGRVLAIDGTSGSLLREVVPVSTSPGYEVLDIAYGLTGQFPSDLAILYRQNDFILVRRPRGEVNGVFARGVLGSVAGRSDINGVLGYSPDGGLFAALGNPTGSARGTGETIGQLSRFSGGFCSASARTMCFQQIGDGIRQPGAFGVIDNAFLLFDRGEDHEHEINRFQETQRPINFGWPFFEGTVEVMSGAPAGLIGPSVVYTAGDGARAGLGLVGGLDYTGSIPGIAGHFVFADKDGTVWSLPREQMLDGFLSRTDRLERRSADFEPDAGSLDAIVAILADVGGTIFILDGDGELFRVDKA